MTTTRSKNASTKNASTKTLSGADFRIFRVSRKLTQQQLADMLGITKQGVQYYERTGVSKVVALALAALDKPMLPYRPTKEDRAEALSAIFEDNDDDTVDA
jgi:transcriptional regulator with XRE-family HTH domain